MGLSIVMLSDMLELTCGFHQQVKKHGSKPHLRRVIPWVIHDLGLDTHSTKRLTIPLLYLVGKDLVARGGSLSEKLKLPLLFNIAGNLQAQRRKGVILHTVYCTDERNQTEFIGCETNQWDPPLVDSLHRRTIDYSQLESLHFGNHLLHTEGNQLLLWCQGVFGTLLVSKGSNLSCPLDTTINRQNLQIRLLREEGRLLKFG